MKLTGKLKKQAEKAQTKEKVRHIIEKAGTLLSDDELDMVSGGKGRDQKRADVDRGHITG